MSHNRGQSHNLRADSPPLIERRIPTPPHLTRPRTSWHRPDSPELITRIPTPPLTSRSFTPSARAEPRPHSVQTYRPKTTVSSRLYNLFHPRQRRVEIIETPVRRRHTVKIQQQSSSTPLVADTVSGGHHHSSRRKPSTPPLTPTKSGPPRRIRRGNTMSPPFPGDKYVPLPEPTPPASKERPSKYGSNSPHRPTEYYANPFKPHEQIIDPEQPSAVTESRPVRIKPDSREALLSENQAFRDQITRYHQEIGKKDHDIENYKAQVAELRDQLADTRDRAIRDKRGSNNEMDELRYRLERCLEERDEQQRLLDDRAREPDSLRRGHPLPPVIIYEGDEDRRSRPVRQTTNSAGMDAIREAQADQRRRGGRRDY